MQTISYYIKEEEFYFLMAALGQKSFYGISSHETGIEKSWTKKEEIHRILISLYQRQYVTWQGDEVRICEPMAGLLKELVCAKRALWVEQDAKTCCGYEVESGYIFVEKSQIEEDTIKLTPVKADQVDEYEKQWQNAAIKKIQVSTGKEL